MVDNKFEFMVVKRQKKVIDSVVQSKQTYAEINKPKIIIQHKIKIKFFKVKQPIKMQQFKIL